MTQSYSNKKEIFSELRDQMFFKPSEVRISSFKNPKIIEEIKTLKVIELDNLASFISYVNYDHFLIFKFNNEFYFCDTELVSSLNTHCMLKITDFNQHLRKDKMRKIQQ